jgi:hypothetical protein
LNEDTVSQSNRRAFLGQLGSAAALGIPGLRQAAASPQAAAAAPQPSGSASFDLLIAGGRVVDPSQKLSAVRDIAIAAGRIARIAENIPPNQARQVFDAKGKIVTPGLIDMHTHVYKYGITLNVDSDVVGFQSGVTTVLDCGSTGAASFLGLRKYVMETVATRVYALLNISTIGLIVTNEIYLDPAMINARAAIQTISNNRDRIMGIKVRVNGKHSDLAHDLEVMKTAREVADATGLPWGGQTCERDDDGQVVWKQRLLWTVDAYQLNIQERIAQRNENHVVAVRMAMECERRLKVRIPIPSLPPRRGIV